MNSSSIKTVPTTGRKTVAITGVGSGLGREFAIALAAESWSVALIGRRRSALEETRDLCRAARAQNQEQEGSSSESSSEPPVDLIIPCDITDPIQVDTCFSTLREQWSQLHVFINNAGTPGPTGSLMDIDPQEWQSTFDTNTTGAFLCTQQALRWMKEQKSGRIINNVSIAAHSPRVHAAAYAASKAALASLTVSTTLEGRDYGVSCVEFDIGNASTDLLDTFTQSSSEPFFSATHAATMITTIASMPSSVSVDKLILTAHGMPYLGRG